MNAELRKMLEESADVFCGCIACPTTIISGRCEKKCTMHEFFKKGFGCGYKEAIAQAKEWWKDHYKLPDYYYSETRDVQEKMRDDYEFHMKVVDDFESDMNKLWEEKK